MTAPTAPSVPTARSLSELVAQQAAASPGAPALVADEVRWSYADLDEAAAIAASRLAALGVGAGGRVGLLATNVAEWPAIAAGAHRLGARVDAFNTWVKAWELDHLLASSECTVLVMVASARSTDLMAELTTLLPELWETTPGEWRSRRYPGLRHVVVLDDGPIPSGAKRWADIVGLTAPHAPEPRPDDVGFVLYTSGSSAAPKAVPLLHRNLVVNGFHIGERMGLTAADRVWLGSPLFWSFGSANAMMATFTHGACLVLQGHFTAADAVELLAAERCSAAYLLPSIVDALLPLAGRVRAIESLRTGLTIGRPEEIRRVTEDLGINGVCNVYGSTETYGNCCVTPHDMPLDERLVSQGPPLPGVQLRVVADDGTVHRADATGELQIRGRIMPGYLGNPEATAAVFTKDGWFRSGDRVSLLTDGTVRFQSRLAEMIKTSGINVSPAEVESYLCRHEDVSAAAVVGAHHPARGEVVVAFVTTRRDDLDGEWLRQWCRRGIAGFKVPFQIVVVPELPRTGTGKILRRALVEEATARVAAVTGGDEQR